LTLVRDIPEVEDILLSAVPSVQET